MIAGRVGHTPKPEHYCAASVKRAAAQLQRKHKLPADADTSSTVRRRHKRDSSVGARPLLGTASAGVSDTFICIPVPCRTVFERLMSRVPKSFMIEGKLPVTLAPIIVPEDVVVAAYMLVTCN